MNAVDFALRKTADASMSDFAFPVEKQWDFLEITYILGNAFQETSKPSSQRLKALALETRLKEHEV